MLISHRRQSKTAVLVACLMTSTAAFPILFSPAATATSEPFAIAQLFRAQRQRVTVPSGTVISVRYDEAERIVVAPDETTPVTLIVAADVRSSAGTVLIPQGSEIEGELQPANGGTQFVAKELRIRNSERELPIDAQSQVITETETIEEGSNVGSILKGAAVGAGAAAILAEVTGDIDVVEVLGGAGAGALAGLLLGGRKEAEVFVVNPETDLDLRLESDLVLN